MINEEPAPVDAGHLDALRLADGNRDGKAKPDVGVNER